MRRPRVEPSEIRARFVRAEAFDDSRLAARAIELLEPAELDVVERIGPAGARRDYIAAHLLARTLLSEIVGCDPARIRFGHSPFGRPEPSAPEAARSLRLSLSHADGVALCAVARRLAVGADVESVRNLGPDPLGVAEIVCSRRELESLRALPAPARAERFLTLWTCKEAIVKAMGLGLRFPLQRISVEPAPDGATEFEVAGTSGDFRGCLWPGRPSPYHFAAVAAIGSGAIKAGIRFEEEPLERIDPQPGLSPAEGEACDSRAPSSSR